MIHPIKHFNTITHHRNKVLMNCIRAGIPCQGLKHDLSKYSFTEFINGAEYYSGDHSPNVDERLSRGYSEAWLHHKGRNKHHFEYWNDYDPGTHISVPVKMPLKYVVEMFCDRVAASKIYQGKNYTDKSPLEYFMKAVKTRQIHPETSNLLQKLLEMLADEGEEKTFRYIKHVLLKQKNY